MAHHTHSGTACAVAFSAVVLILPGTTAAQPPAFTFTRITDSVATPQIGATQCLGMNDLGTVVISMGGQLLRGRDATSLTGLPSTASGICPSINDHDEIAYFRQVGTPQHLELVKYANGNETTLAPAPGTPALSGGVPTYLPSLNNAGRAAYIAGAGNTIAIAPIGTTLTPPQNFVTPASMNDGDAIAFAAADSSGKGGLYRGSTTPLLQDGDAISGGTLRFSWLQRPSVNNAGTVAFAGHLDVGGVSASGVFVTDGSSVTLVGTNIVDRFSLNDAGSVVYRKSSGAGSSLYVGRPGLIDQKVIGFGDALDGSTFNGGFIWEESLNNLGQVAFWAELSDGRRGVYVATPKPATAGTPQYFAEGATSEFFDTRLALLNPGDTDTTASITFARGGGASSITTQVPVPARRRVTLDPKTIAGMATAEFSTRIESDRPLVADRTMSWDVRNGYGAHAETSVAAPALTWYLAEGSTLGEFNLFYLLQNPNAVPAVVRVRYLLPSGAPLEKTYTLAPSSRTNIWVNVEEFGALGKALAHSDVSAVIDVTNGQPIIVERAMYLNAPGQLFGAGHESAGVTTPATEWFLAEGATGPFFDLFALVANPTDSDARIEATYLLPDGTVLTRPYTVTANSRFNIWVDLEDSQLADTAVSIIIRSLDAVPIIVERAMWWPGGGWYEAHNSPGATTTGTAWALAEGEDGGPRSVATYILLANTSATNAQVKVTLLFEDGTSAARTFPVTARSRFNVDARHEFPEAANRRFGAIVESLGATPAQLVVERAMYWDALGQKWAAGTNALGTKLR